MMEYTVPPIGEDAIRPINLYVSLGGLVPFLVAIQVGACHAAVLLFAACASAVAASLASASKWLAVANLLLGFAAALACAARVGLFATCAGRTRLVWLCGLIVSSMVYAIGRADWETTAFVTAVVSASCAVVLLAAAAISAAVDGRSRGEAATEAAGAAVAIKLTEAAIVGGATFLRFGDTLSLLLGADLSFAAWHFSLWVAALLAHSGVPASRHRHSPAAHPYSLDDAPAARPRRAPADPSVT